ncbi:MAG: DUF4193 family protein [bacterium]|nr:DUF4193 family protein [bacterium]
MSNDEMIVEDELSDDAASDDLFDEDESIEEDTLLDDDADDAESTVATKSDDDGDDTEADGDTEALDDLEAEELEMLTEDEAKETIVVDEETQLRDIRRAQISMESGVASSATEGEFVCSICFLVKKSSQLSSRRKKVCLDCAN